MSTIFLVITKSRYERLSDRHKATLGDTQWWNTGCGYRYTTVQSVTAAMQYRNIPGLRLFARTKGEAHGKSVVTGDKWLAWDDNDHWRGCDDRSESESDEGEDDEEEAEDDEEEAKGSGEQ